MTANSSRLRCLTLKICLFFGLAIGMMSQSAQAQTEEPATVERTCADSCKEANEIGLRPLINDPLVDNSPLCCCLQVNGEWVDGPEVECEAPYVPSPEPTLLPDA